MNENLTLKVKSFDLLYRTTGNNTFCSCAFRHECAYVPFAPFLKYFFDPPPCCAVVAVDIIIDIVVADIT